MIYFLRHGETIWNREHRYQGAKDSPLTEMGIRQTEIACQILSKEVKLPNPLIVYVSPLKRAIDTANILSKFIKVDIIIEDRLKEVSLGSWDGKTRDEIQNENPVLMKGTHFYDWHFRSPDGEDLQSAKSRVSSWMKEVEGMNIGVVAHGMLGRILMGLFLGLDDDEMLKQAIAQDAFYKLESGKIYAIGKAVLNDDEA